MQVTTKTSQCPNNTFLDMVKTLYFRHFKIFKKSLIYGIFPIDMATNKRYKAQKLKQLEQFEI